MKLLLAVWGKPKYEKVKYNFKGQIRETHTPLTVLQEEINPDKTIIYVADSLASPGKKRYEEILREAKEEVGKMPINMELKIQKLKYYLETENLVNARSRVSCWISITCCSIIFPGSWWTVRILGKRSVKSI